MSAPAAPASPVRLGIVGTGQVVLSSYLPILVRIPGVQVVALCDVNPERLALAVSGVQERGGGYPVQAYADYRELLERDDLDAVLVATPTDRHEEVAVAALRRGLDVLLEKPMSPTLAGARRILDAWRASGRLLQVGYVYRYSPLIRRLVELLRGGEIGAVRQFWVHEFRGAFYEAWRFDPERSGGALLEKICHHADLFNWALGCLPVRVFAVGGQAVMRRGETVEVLSVLGTTIRVTDSRVVDHAWVVAEYESGAVGSYGVNFFCPYGFWGRDRQDHESLEIGAIGERGAVLCHVRRHEIRVRRAASGEEQVITIPPASGGPAGWHTGTAEQLEAFVQCVRTRTPPLADGVAGLAGMLLPLAAERSIATGAPVAVREIAGQEVTA